MAYSVSGIYLAHLPYYSAKAIRSLGKRVSCACFGCSVARVGDDLKCGLGPFAVQIPGVHNGTNYVIPSMHDNCRDVSNHIDMFQQIVISFEERVVLKVMTLDASKGEGFLGFAKVIDHPLVAQKF